MTRWFFLLFAFVACNPSSSSGGQTSGPSSIGPEGGIIDFDASAIPTPWDESGAPPPGGDGGIPSGDSGIPSDDGGAGIPEAGFDDVAASCSGVATPCSLASSCASVSGCSLQGSCTGLAESCFGQFSSFACISLQGCVWDSSTNSCAGSSWSCNLFSGSATCVSQLGCNWSSMCGGTPTPCSLIPAATCTTQPGCFLQ